MSIIPGLTQAQWIATGVGAVALIAGSALGTYKITHAADTVRYQALEVADANAQVAALARAAQTQKALDASGAAAGLIEEAAQQTIVTRTVTLTKEVPVYVTVAQDKAAAAPGAKPGCVSYGLVRVLDAAVLGVSPGTLALPAGATSDTCSPVEPSALASGVAGNYGVAQQNAKQLTDLVAEVQKQVAIQAAP